MLFSYEYLPLVGRGFVDFQSVPEMHKYFVMCVVHNENFMYICNVLKTTVIWKKKPNND